MGDDIDGKDLSETRKLETNFDKGIYVIPTHLQGCGGQIGSRANSIRSVFQI